MVEKELLLDSAGTVQGGEEMGSHSQQQVVGAQVRVDVLARALVRMVLQGSTDQACDGLVCLAPSSMGCQTKKWRRLQSLEFYVW